MKSPLPMILSQHAEEAAFQWLLRSDAVHAPHYSLPDLAHLDDLVDAHLDGLRVAGEPGWEICRAELAWQEPGELFTAAVLAYESGLRERIEPVEAAATGEAAPGLASALGWLPQEVAQPHYAALLQSPESRLRRLGVAAMAMHRQDEGGLVLAEALLNPDKTVTPRALRAVGELGRRELLSPCLALMTSDDPASRFWAAWAATLLGDKNAVRALTEISGQPGPHAALAGMVAARSMVPEQARTWHKQLVQENERLAAQVAGAAGDPAAVPWLIEAMAVDEQARVAGEAFSFITGLDLAYVDLDRDRPEDFEAGPTEDPDDNDVAMDPDEDLAWPDPGLVTVWWSENQRRFKPGQRYLMGEPITRESAGRVLVSGRQRQRAAAALELALQQPGQPLFEVQARGDRQQLLLSDQSASDRT